MEIADKRSGNGTALEYGKQYRRADFAALTPVLAAGLGWENALHFAALVSIVAGVLWLRIYPGSVTRMPASLGL
jgi:hypothetical protein